MLRRPLLLAPKAGKMGKERELKEKGARDFSWMMKTRRINKASLERAVQTWVIVIRK
jgi:hypothetical protein